MRTVRMPAHLEYPLGKHPRVRLVVPPRLVPIVGKANLRESLGTSNPVEIRRLKPQVEGRLQAILDAAEAQLRPVPLVHLSNVHSFDQEAFLARIEAMLTAPEAGPDIVDAVPADAKPAEASLVVPVESVLRDWAKEENIKSKGQGQRAAIMARFFDWLAKGARDAAGGGLDAGHTDMGRVTPDDLERYRAYLIERIGLHYKRNTAGEELRAVKTTFRFAHETTGKSRFKLPTNPAANVKAIGGKSGTRLRFSDEDRVLILSEARKSNVPIIRWGNWMAAFAVGSRMAEIAEARTDDFRVVDGAYCYVIREDWRDLDQTLKTEQSERTVPLSPFFIKEGFVEYLEGVRRKHHGGGHGPLFPTVKLDKHRRRNTYASNIVGEWLSPLVNDQRKQFHSWRKTVITLLESRNKVHPALVRYIVGHAAPKDVHERHYLDHPMPELVWAIGLIDDPTVRAEPGRIAALRTAIA
jgi:integrase